MTEELTNRELLSLMNDLDNDPNIELQPEFEEEFMNSMVIKFKSNSWWLSLAQQNKCHEILKKYGYLEGTDSLDRSYE